MKLQYALEFAQGQVAGGEGQRAMKTNFFGARNHTQHIGPRPRTLQLDQGGADAFVTRIAPTGTGSPLVYSTYLGGSGEDGAWGIAVDPGGRAYVVGHTDSTDFPTVFPWQPLSGGARDAFVVKFSPTGFFSYSTYLGGSAEEFAVPSSGGDNA